MNGERDPIDWFASVMLRVVIGMTMLGFLLGFVIAYLLWAP